MTYLIRFEFLTFDRFQPGMSISHNDVSQALAEDGYGRLLKVISS